MDEDESGHDGAAEEEVHPLDQERSPMLQLERRGGHHQKLQGAVAAERRGPGGNRPIGAGDRRPRRLEPGEMAAALRDDRRRKLGDGNADGAEAAAARLARRRSRR